MTTSYKLKTHPVGDHGLVNFNQVLKEHTFDTEDEAFDFQNAFNKENYHTYPETATAFAVVEGTIET